MSSYPLVKYVDAPATTATVRYDFNDQAPNPATNPAKKVTEFDPGVPTLEGDPDAVGQQWGFRSPSITHTIKGTKAQAMAALSAVSREQLRRTNWVLFQPSAATQPVWFKTYRTGYQPITLDRVYVRVDGGGTAPLPDTWKITVPLVADAFTYGARVNAVTGAILTMNSTAANPMRLVLPAIKGDAPTGLRVTVASTAGAYAFGESWLIGCTAGDATMVDTFTEIGTGDGFTAGSGTAAATPSAAYSNGSYRAVTIAAATPNLLERLSGVHNGLVAGRYKILLRCELDATAGAKTYTFQYVSKNGTSLSLPPVTNPAVAVSVPATQTFQGWVDLGDYSFPIGSAQTAPVGIAGLNAPNFGLKMGTADGSAGAARIDAFKLIPVDGINVISSRLLKVTLPSTQLRQAIFDTDAESIWLYDTTPNFFDGSASCAGAFPIADPAAARNVLLFMATGTPSPLGGTTYHTSVTTTATIDVSYHPRYLHVGDGT